MRSCCTCCNELPIRSYRPAILFDSRPRRLARAAVLFFFALSQPLGNAESRTREEETGLGPRHQLCACKLPVPRCNASIWWSTIIRTIYFSLPPPFTLSLSYCRLVNRYCAQPNLPIARARSAPPSFSPKTVYLRTATNEDHQFWVDLHRFSCCF